MNAPTARIGHSCPVCESADSETVLQFKDLPVMCNVLHDTAAEAMATDTAEIVLDVCGRCGMLWNAAFEPTRVTYGPGYENSLYGSRTFQRFASGVCERLADAYDLSGSLIVEVGSGNGRFLMELCAEAAATGLGIDPSYRGPDHPVPNVRLVREEDGVTERARLVVIRHVLEHTGFPHDFLTGVSARCAPDGSLYCEVPNARTMLRNGAFWDLIYEHPLYFSSGPLIELLGRCGFSTQRMASEYDDQFLCVDAVRQVPPVTRPNLEADLEAVHAFARAFHDTRNLWCERLEAWADQGRRIALWGIGSKGTTFLSAIGGPFVDVLVDVNERKHGRYVPGVGRPVHGPAVLSEDAPDLVLVSNPVYLEEIGAELEGLGVAAELVTLWDPDMERIRA